jgi:hypothetical protein
VITGDHRFRPLLGDPAVCAECKSPKLAPQHFGEYTGPVVPVPGFTCVMGPVRAARRTR